MKVTQVHKEIYGMSYTDVINNLIVKDNSDSPGYSSCEVIANDIVSNVDVSSLTLKSIVEIDYEEDELDRKVLNFIFITPNKSEFLLGMELEAGSWSKWQYGCWVKVSIKDKEISSACW